MSFAISQKYLMDEIAIEFDSGRRLGKLAEFRTENRYCDVDLIVEGRKISAHKFVLAVGSEFFKNELIKGESTLSPLQNSLSSGEILPTKDTKCILEITHKTTYGIMLSIVNYLYTGTLEYCSKDMMLVLANFHDLGIEYDTILEQIRKDAQDLRREISLKKLASHYIAFNLDGLYTMENFKKLSKDELFSILVLVADTDISSIIIFQAITTWIEYDKLSRAYNVGTFFKFIRFDNMHCREIKNNVFTNTTFRDSTTACKSFLNMITDSTSPLNYNVVEEPKLYVFSRGPDTTMYTLRDLDYYYDRVESKRPALEAFSMTKYKNVIYAVGGRRHNQIVNIGLKYDTVKETWSEFLCPIGKIGCGVCTRKNGKMFVIGGVTGSDCQKSCSSYDYASGRWTPLPDMTNARWNPAVSACNSAIYVFGGNIREDNPPIVERYDPREGVWCNEGSLPYYQGSVSTSIHQKIYLTKIGKRKLICFDTRTKSFSVAFDLNTTDSDDKQIEWISAGGSLLFILRKQGITRFFPEDGNCDEACIDDYPAYSIIVS